MCFVLCSIFADEDEAAESLQVMALIRVLFSAGDRLTKVHPHGLSRQCRERSPAKCRRVMIVCSGARRAPWKEESLRWLQVCFPVSEKFVVHERVKQSWCRSRSVFEPQAAEVLTH